MVRFGECAGRQHLAFRNFRQQPLFHGIAAETQYAFGSKARKNNRAADRRILRAERFSNEDVFQDAQTLTGICLGKVNADETEVSGFFPYLFRKSVSFFQLNCQGFVKFAFGKFMCGLLYLSLGCGQLKGQIFCYLPSAG